MGIAVNFDASFVNEAKSYASLESRSIAKQIEHWAKIGKIAEENPDLSFDFIRSILFGLEDVKKGRLEEYIPGAL